jgi:hypothetical protein
LHVPLHSGDGPLRFSGQHEHLTEAPISEIGVEGGGPFEHIHGLIVLAPATENMRERSERFGLTGVKLDRLTS